MSMTFPRCPCILQDRLYTIKSKSFVFFCQLLYSYTTTAKKGIALSGKIKAEVEFEKKLSVSFLLRDAGEGGAERSSLRLASGLSRRGLAVTVFFLKAEGPMLKQLHENIEIVNLKGSFIRLMKELKVRHVDFLLPVYTAMRALLAKFSGRAF